MKIRTLSIALLFMKVLAAQQEGKPFRDTLSRQENLSSALFNRSDTLKDSIWIKGGLEQYFNQAINAAVHTSGDFPPGGEDSLIFCTCRSKHDTIYVGITGPSACCYTSLNLVIYKNSFEVSAAFSYDVAPDLILLRSQKKKLILKGKGSTKADFLQGWLYFEGKGISAVKGQEGSQEEKSLTWKARAVGYFKCRVDNQ